MLTLSKGEFGMTQNKSMWHSCVCVSSAACQRQLSLPPPSSLSGFWISFAKETAEGTQRWLFCIRSSKTLFKKDYPHSKNVLNARQQCPFIIS